MLARVDLFDGLRDAPVFINHVADAFRVSGILGITGAISQPDLSFGVAQQTKGEAEFFCESFILFYGVETDAEYLRILFSVAWLSIAKPAAFGSSDKTTRRRGDL